MISSSLNSAKKKSIKTNKSYLTSFILNEYSRGIRINVIVVPNIRPPAIDKTNGTRKG